MNVLRARRQGEWVALAGLDLLLRVSEAGDGEGLTANTAPGGECRLGIRPENVLLSETGAPCVVEHTLALGSYNLLSLRLVEGVHGPGEGFLKAWLPAGIRFAEGETVRVTFLPSGCRWFDGGANGASLPWRTLEVQCRPT